MTDMVTGVCQPGAASGGNSETGFSYSCFHDDWHLLLNMQQRCLLFPYLLKSALLDHLLNALYCETSLISRGHLQECTGPEQHKSKLDSPGDVASMPNVVDACLDAAWLRGPAMLRHPNAIPNLEQAHTSAFSITALSTLLPHTHHSKQYIVAVNPAIPPPFTSSRQTRDCIYDRIRPYADAPRSPRLSPSKPVSAFGSESSAIRHSTAVQNGMSTTLNTLPITRSSITCKPIPPLPGPGSVASLLPSMLTFKNGRALFVTTSPMITSYCIVRYDRCVVVKSWPAVMCISYGSSARHPVHLSDCSLPSGCLNSP